MFFFFYNQPKCSAVHNDWTSGQSDERELDATLCEYSPMKSLVKRGPDHSVFEWKGAKGLDTCQEEIPLCLQLSYKENVVLNISHPKRRIHRRKKIVLADEYIDNKLGELIRLTPHPHPHPHPILSKLNKKWFFSWFSGAALFPLTQLITCVILGFFFFFFTFTEYFKRWCW